MEQELTARPLRRWIRTAWFVVPAAAFVALLAFGTLRSPSAPVAGVRAPDFEAPLLGRQGTLSMDGLQGRPVVLNFWASWCVPCEDEAPMFAQAHRAYGDRIALVGVNIKDARSDALAFAGRHRLDYLHVRDDSGAIFDLYGLTGQPETFFIDAEGVIVEHVPGAIATREQLFGLLDLLVARDG